MPIVEAFLLRFLQRLAGVAILIEVFGETAFGAREAEFKAHGAERVDKDELFRRSDVISIHTVLSPRTRGLVGSRELALMKVKARPLPLPPTSSSSPDR